jgi:hypothetical protein
MAGMSILGIEAMIGVSLASFKFLAIIALHHEEVRTPVTERQYKSQPED